MTRYALLIAAFFGGILTPWSASAPARTHPAPVQFTSAPARTHAAPVQATEVVAYAQPTVPRNEVFELTLALQRDYGATGNFFDVDVTATFTRDGTGASTASTCSTVSSAPWRRASSPIRRRLKWSAS